MSYNKYFEQLDSEKEDAELEYKKLLIEDADKTYKDLLPKEFSTAKRGIIIKEILQYIEETEKILNTSGLFDRIISKKDIVRYMMRGTAYSNFFLAYKFIPKISDMKVWSRFWIEQKGKAKLSDEDREKQMNSFYKENREEFKKYEDISHCLQGLKQFWESYEARTKIRKGELVNSYDMEKTGFPSTSRGSLCYLFIPVKGVFPKNAEGILKLYNPRNKKDENFEILEYSVEDNTYACKNTKGKKVFLTPYDDVANAYDCLFSINKEIYSGWWNKVMFIK